MTSKQALLIELEHLPSNIVDEVYRYATFLKATQSQNPLGDTALASEKALAKDWLLPEEDAVWANL
ncbi:MAG: DUF2281 domain-containing protein [Oscillospiraceae bacterium]|nr:DUF2281 domain-containing protein [Oscillospiraceae bacterium]